MESEVEEVMESVTRVGIELLGQLKIHKSKTIFCKKNPTWFNIFSTKTCAVRTQVSLWNSDEQSLN